MTDNIITKANVVKKIKVQCMRKYFIRSDIKIHLVVIHVQFYADLKVL